jgi:hypothetical protein
VYKTIDNSITALELQMEYLAFKLPMKAGSYTFLRCHIGLGRPETKFKAAFYKWYRDYLVAISTNGLGITIPSKRSLTTKPSYLGCPFQHMPCPTSFYGGIE